MNTRFLHFYFIYLLCWCVQNAENCCLVLGARKSRVLFHSGTKLLLCQALTVVIVQLYLASTCLFCTTVSEARVVVIPQFVFCGRRRRMMVGCGNGLPSCDLQLN